MMQWTHNYAALGNSLILTALVVSIPIFFLLWALAVKGMKGYIAGLLALCITLVDVVIVYKMPVSIALSATAYGMLYGLWPIAGIILTAVYLYNLIVESGKPDYHPSLYYTGNNPVILVGKTVGTIPLFFCPCFRLI